jgi:hypothetical protein
MVASSVIVNNLVQILPNPNALTIKPRLEYGVYLVDRISEKLQIQYEMVLDSNHKYYSQNRDFIADSPEFKKQVQLEAILLCAIKSLELVRKRLVSISQLSNIVEVLPLVTVIRTTNSNIYSSLPHLSGDFVELSGILGSIATDSGSLVEATFDFKQTNLESKQILAEVNLIVDSKINKQYPNLNF